MKFVLIILVVQQSQIWQSLDTEAKKQQYAYVNFQNVEKAGEFWFIANDSKENREKYCEVIEKSKEKDFQSKLKEILEFLKVESQYQSATNLRRRTERLKELLKEYGKAYKNIAVVSHYNIIRYTLAKEFSENDEPFHCTIRNCQVLTAEVQDL